MEIRSRTLRSMTRAVDEMHRDAMHSLVQEAGARPLDPTGRSRRRFLVGAGTGGALLTVAPLLAPASWLSGAAAQDNSSSAAPAPTTTTTAPAATGDDALTVFACSMELALVDVYQRLTPQLTDPDRRAIAGLFGRHHLDHAEAFRALAVADKVAAPDPTKLVASQPVLDLLNPAIAGLIGDDAIGRFTLTLENQAAYTYAHLLTVLEGEQAFGTTATVLPIDSQHAAVLGNVLGLGPAEIFPTGAFEVAAVGDGRDPRRGLDPKLFPPTVGAAAATESSEK